MTARAGLALALASGLFALSSCAEKRPGAAPVVAVDHVDSCRYDVLVRSENPLRLAVTASCRGRGVRGFGTPDEAVASAVLDVTSDAGQVVRRGNAFELDRARGAVSFRYEVDLEALAARTRRFDVALRSGRSLIAPASSFLLHPLPLDAGTSVEVHVRTPPGYEFSTGLEREGDHYRLGAHEIPVATYSVFGAVEQRSLTVGGNTELELVVLDGALEVKNDVLAAWATKSARAVAAFYSGFPARRVLVAVVPVTGEDEVVFGKLLPESAPGIVLLVGSRATERDLYADWVLVHELFHVGVPSFYEEGKWFDEGLATYFEPIIRVRAGLYDEVGLWREFVRQMPRGVPALTRDGLEHARGFSGLYWGGALYCLLADITLRKQSGGRLGLENGLLRVRAEGGQASEVWGLKATLRTADSAFPEPVLGPLAARYEDRPAPFDLAGVFRELGVGLGDSDVVLRNDAPSSWLRRAIVHGKP